MAQVIAKIDGASDGAEFSWDNKLVSLTDLGGGSFSGDVPANDATPGIHVLGIDVHGAPNDPWTATVTGLSMPLNFSGHMSSRRSDTTGDRFVEVL
jgi:hypothetical protein